MALSDCPKCWDTPCTCGYNLSYKIQSEIDAKDRKIKELEFVLDQVMKSKEVLVCRIKQLEKDLEAT